MKRKMSVLFALTMMLSVLFSGSVVAAPSYVHEQDTVILDYDFFQDPSAPMSVTSDAVYAPPSNGNPNVGYVQIQVKKTGGQAVYWELKDEAGNLVGQNILQHTGDMVRLTFNVQPDQTYRLTVGCHTGPNCSAKGKIATLTQVTE